MIPTPQDAAVLKHAYCSTPTPHAAGPCWAFSQALRLGSRFLNGDIATSCTWWRAMQELRKGHEGLATGRGRKIGSRPLDDPGLKCGFRNLVRGWPCGVAD